MEEHIVINKNEAVDASESYVFLRQQGLNYIQSLAGKIWTDYNTHDPGITMMELLCYAITDLGKRTSADMADIVVDELLSEDHETRFFKAADILTNNALTKNDYRKLLSDINGIKNVFLFPSSDLKAAIEQSGIDEPPYRNLFQPYKVNYSGSELETWDPAVDSAYPDVVRYVNGLYNIVMEFEEELLPRTDDNAAEADAKSATRYDLLFEVLARFFKGRNLCEDFHKIGVFFPNANYSGGDSIVIPVGLEKIVITAEVEISPDANEEDVLAEIYLRIARYISPSVKFNSFEDLLNEGKRIDEIIDGPLLEHGFVDDEELSKLVPKTMLYSSDIINEVMDIEGVVDIQSVAISSNAHEESPGVYTFSSWKFELQNGVNTGVYLQPVLSVFVDGTESDPTNIKLSKGTVRVIPDREAVWQKLKELKNRSGKQSVYNTVSELGVPQGESQDFEDYFAVQNELPLVYGTGLDGLPSSTDNLTTTELQQRIAQSRQLKAYLLFYEQLLVNYLAQLNAVKHLLSWDDIVAGDKTYFSKALSSQDIKNYNDLFVGTPPTLSQLDVLAETDVTYLDRKNRFLNHLMARFNESLTRYSLLMFDQDEGLDLAKDKVNFLKDYPLISRDRGKSYGYFLGGTQETWDTDNISGYQRRIARFMGIDDPRTRSVAQSSKIIQDTTTGKWYYQLTIPFQGTVLSSDFTLQGSEVDDAATAGKELDDFLIIATDNDPAYVSGHDTDGYFFKIILDDNGTILVLDDKIVKSQYFLTAAERDAALTITEQHFSALDGEGLHVVEHILLRPTNASDIFLNVFIGPGKIDTCPKDIDPYSFRITVILPAWPKKFRSAIFRKYAEDVMRAEAPAHVAVDFKWVTNAQLKDFEDCYSIFLASQVQRLSGSSTTCIINDLNGFNDVYAAHYNVAPPKNEDFFTDTDADGYVLATVVNPNGSAIVHAEIRSVSVDPTTISTFFRRSDQNTYNTDFPVDYTIGSGAYKPAGTDVWIDFDNITGEFSIINGTDVLPGTWQVDVFTVDELAFQAQHRIQLTIIKDKEATPIYNSKHVNSYVDGDLLLTFDDDNVGDDANDIVLASIIADPATTGIPPGTTFNGGNGNITVSDAAALVAAVTPTNHIFTVKIKTTDATGGITIQVVFLDITPDTEAIYTVLPARSEVAYNNWDLLAHVEDVDGDNGEVDTAAQQDLIPKPLPPGTVLITDETVAAGYVTEYMAAKGGTTTQAENILRVGSIFVIDKTLFHYDALTNGNWPVRILTTDRYNGTTVSDINIKLFMDRPAVYTGGPFRSPQCYNWGEQLATVIDPDGTGVVSAVFQDTVNYPIPQNVIIDPVNGTISIHPVVAPSIPATQTSSVGSATQLAKFMNTNQLYISSKPFAGLDPKVYTVKVKTTDSLGGVTINLVNLDLTEKKTVYQVADGHPYTGYASGQALAVPYTPPGEGLKSATLLTGKAGFGPLPPGVSLDAQTGKISISDPAEFKQKMKMLFTPPPILQPNAALLSQSAVSYLETSGSYLGNSTRSADGKSITFKSAIKTEDDCGVITAMIPVSLVFLNDTPSVLHSPKITSITSIEQGTQFPTNPDTISAEDYKNVGALIMSFTDADNGSSNFQSVTVVQGNFFNNKAAIEYNTGKVTVSDGSLTVLAATASLNPG